MWSQLFCEEFPDRLPQLHKNKHRQQTVSDSSIICPSLHPVVSQGSAGSHLIRWKREIHPGQVASPSRGKHTFSHPNLNLRIKVRKVLLGSRLHHGHPDQNRQSSQHCKTVKPQYSGPPTIQARTTLKTTVVGNPDSTPNVEGSPVRITLEIEGKESKEKSTLQ